MRNHTRRALLVGTFLVTAAGLALAATSPAGAQVATPDAVDACEDRQPHPTIRILDDAQLGAPGTGVTNPSADGTAENPYVIEGWCIVGPGKALDQNSYWADAGPGVYVEDTDAHVVVRDVAVVGLDDVKDMPTVGFHIDSAANVAIEDSEAVGVSTGLLVTDAQDVQVDGFHTPGAETGVEITGSQGITVAGATVTDSQLAVVIDETTDSTILASTLEKQNRGVSITGSSGITVAGTTVTDSAWRGAIYITASDNVVLDGNLVTDNDSNGISAERTISGVPSAITVLENTVTDNGGHGIYLERSDGSMAAGNVVSGNAGIGILNERGDNFVAAHNTVTANNVAIQAEGEQGFWTQDPALDNSFIANQVSDNQVGVVAGDATPGLAVNDNNLEDNTFGTGLDASSSTETVDATENWWGCADGPSHADCDDVIGDADVDPWLTAANPDAGAAGWTGTLSTASDDAATTSEGPEQAEDIPLEECELETDEESTFTPDWKLTCSAPSTEEIEHAKVTADLEWNTRTWDQEDPWGPGWETGADTFLWLNNVDVEVAFAGASAGVGDDSEISESADAECASDDSQGNPAETCQGDRRVTSRTSTDRWNPTCETQWSCSVDVSTWYSGGGVEDAQSLNQEFRYRSDDTRLNPELFLRFDDGELTVSFCESGATGVCEFEQIEIPSQP